MTCDRITLVEKGEFLQDETTVAGKLNDFFSNVVKNLNIKINDDLLNDDSNEVDPIMNAIKKYSHHPSILKLIEFFENKTVNSKRENKFCFKPTTYETVYNEIALINPAKASPKDSIFARKLHIDFNFSIGTCTYPNNLKLADVMPIYKKGNLTDKGNYRPISILTSLSKVFERLLYWQMYSFTESLLSINQCGLRKGFSAQHCLIPIIEKWRTSVNNKLIAGILLTDLSKAFDLSTTC